jgi:hypothetical protein
MQLAEQQQQYRTRPRDRPMSRACVMNARPCRVPITLAALAALSAHSPAAAHADKYEAQWSMRPLAGVAMWREETTTGNALAAVGGAMFGVSYGLSNRLDVGAEISVLGSSLATFKGSSIVYDGGLPLGDGLQRRAVGSHLLIGPTWRFGVAWVPVVTVAAGGGMRARSEGEFLGTQVRPMEKRADQAMDFAALVRVGLEHRVQRRVTIGGYLSTLTAWGPGMPLMPVLSLSFGVSYVHYPRLGS